MKRWLGLLLMTITLAACNTIGGAGKDVDSGGEKLHDTAKDVQHKM